MEVLAEESIASYPEINVVSSTMKRESRFFLGIEKPEIQILTDLLEDLNSFLDGADAKSVERLMGESVMSWLEQTKDVTEFKGLVEEDCLLKLSKVLQERRIVNFLTRAGRRFTKLKLGEIRNQVSETQNSKEDKTSSRICIVDPQNRTFFNTLANDCVDSVPRDLIVWLTEREAKCSILSVLGPTIARRVYESEAVNDHFDFCCWIDVSGPYKFEDLREFIIKTIQAVKTDAGPLDGMILMDLVGVLRKSLQSKRYLLVFDDVDRKELWELMKLVLPNDNIGSRVIMTTTSDEVINSFTKDSFVLKLGPFQSDTMSWDLFCSIAFRAEPEMRCPTELKQLSSDVIRLCEGLPLRIMRIAGLLSKQQKRLSEWTKVVYRFQQELESNCIPPHVNILTFSILDLPDHLRQCFLYFSMFPIDSLIPTSKLFTLWIAEGFIENKIEKTLEEVAEEYLNELIVRGLVQPCQASYEFGQFCEVEALMHSAAHIKADELGFRRVWNGIDSSRMRGTHRLSIHKKADVVLEKIDSQVRSILLFGVKLFGVSIGSLINKCAALTMLDFEDYPIEHVPEELSRLSNLKYLCLKNTKVKKLPKSIQKLQKLQTLDCTNTPLTELPAGINKLENLRYLLASGYGKKGVRIKEGLGALVNLHSLMTIEAHFGIIKELSKLKQLRKLGLSGLTAETVAALWTSIDELGHLESLTLRAMTNSEALDLRTISPSLPRLKSLVLKGLLPKLPSWIFPLQNLNFLCLSLSRLTHDPMKYLSRLPNLESLWLYRAYEGEQLYFEEGGFERLKLLSVRELHGLNVFEIEDSALPLLEELRIGSSPLLNEVPIGISHLRNLKVLVNYDMPKEFVVSMQPNGGPDFWKVEHIASVVFLYRVQGRDYQLFKLGDPVLLDHLVGLARNRSDFVQHSHEHELDFSESDCEEDDDVGRLSFSGESLTIPLTNSKRWSFSSGFYTDDIEE